MVHICLKLLGYMHLCGSACEVASSSSSVMAEVGLLPELPVIGQVCLSAFRNTGLATVVGKLEQCVPGCLLCLSSAFGAGSVLSYQCTGALGHLQWMLGRLRSDLVSSGSHIHQQYYCNVLCEESESSLLQPDLPEGNKALAFLHQGR